MSSSIPSSHRCLSFWASVRLVATFSLALIVVLSTQLRVLGQTCPVSATQPGSIAAGDPTQTGRITRDGVASDCNGKAYPGTFDSAPGRRFDSYTFTNTNPGPICVQVTLNGTIAGLHSVAYIGAFNPANIQQNYAGDLGVIYTANTNASYSFSVPAGASFDVVVPETVAGGATANYTLTVECITAPPPLPTVGQVLISEFRLAGPGSGAGSVKDEYIELYNNTDGPLTVGNFRLGGFDPNFFGPADGADFFFTIPAGTIIPARGHLLLGDNSTDVPSYSLAAYATLSTPFTCGAGCDFYIDNEGIQLLTPTAAPVQVVIDSVGFTGSGGRPGEINVYNEGTALPRRTQVSPTVQYAYVRRLASGFPQDTNNNATDFQLVSVNSSAFPLAAGGNTQSILGAPGPENPTSPVHNPPNIQAGRVDSGVTAGAAPNFEWSGTGVVNGTLGTIAIRRKFTNTTGAPLTALRFRIVDISTLNSPGGPHADLRAISSADSVVPISPGGGGGTAQVRGTQVEAPTNLAQAMGGALNSSLATITPVTPLADGASVNIEFLLGIQQEGSYQFIVIAEGLPRVSLISSVSGCAGNPATTCSGAPTAGDATIRGQVVDSSGTPLSGVVVRLNGTQSRKTITDSHGNYHFDSVETNGFYTVTPSRSDYSFNPASRSFSQVANQTEATFAGAAMGNRGNPISTPEYFVRQHYLDFLGREPDEAGLNFWSDQIITCGNDVGCMERRTINVSAAYFLSIEFQETGGLVDGLYRASYGRAPLFSEFMPDTAMVGRDVVVGKADWQSHLAANKREFLDAWVQRAAFRAVYDGLSPSNYVDTLIGHTGVSFTASERDLLVSGLNDGTLSRASVLERVAQNDRFVKAKFNEAFVRMQYFGYLRRGPDESGFQFWLNKLNQFNGNFVDAEMVKAFINSGEYRDRFQR